MTSAEQRTDRTYGERLAVLESKVDDLRHFVWGTCGLAGAAVILNIVNLVTRFPYHAGVPGL